MAPENPVKPPQDPQRGAITILVVLSLLVLLTTLTFAMSRNALLEISNSGTVWQAARASEASEAGLDWYLLWSNRDNLAQATGRDREKLTEAMQQLNTTGLWQTTAYLLNPSFVDGSGSPWDRAIRLTSNERSTNSDMVLTRTGTAFQQAGLATVQSFDVTVRYLGKSDVAEISGGAGGSGSTAGTATPRTGRYSNLYQVQGIGKASVPTGTSSYMRYTATREMYVTSTP